MKKPKNPGPKPVDVHLLAYHQMQWLIVLQELHGGIPSGSYLTERIEIKRHGAQNGKTLELGKDYIRILTDRHFDGTTPETRTLANIFSRKTKTINSMRATLKASPKLKLLTESGVCLRNIDDYSRALLAAKQYRFPSSKRPTSAIKKLVHCAAALAGADAGIRPATAIDTLRKLKHGIECPCAPCRLERKQGLDRILEPLRQFFSERDEELRRNPPLGYRKAPPRTKRIGVVLFHA